MYQCYYTTTDGKQCENRQDDCWCCSEHKRLWQEQNYPVARDLDGKKKLSIKEMQKRLLEMGAKKGGTKQLPIDSGGSFREQPDA